MPKKHKFHVFVFQVRGSNPPSTLRTLEICSSPEPQSLKGNFGGKRKPKNASSPGIEKKSDDAESVTNYEFENSIVLVGAVLNSDRKLLSLKQETTIFDTIRNILNSVLSKEKKLEGPWVGDVSNYVRCAYLWALSALKEASLHATETSSTNSNDAMDDLLSWIKENLLPSLCHTENVPITQNKTDGRNGDRCQDKKLSNLDGILSPAMKFPPRSRVRLGTPGKDLKLPGNSTSPTFGFLVGVKAMQVILLVLSDAIVMNILIPEVVDLMRIIAENISSCPDKILIVKALKQILMRMSALLTPSGEETELAVKNIENLINNCVIEEVVEEEFDDDKNENENENKNEIDENENIENEYGDNVNQAKANEGDDNDNDGVHRTPGYKKLSVKSMNETPVKNIFPQGIEDDFTRLSIDMKNK